MTKRENYTRILKKERAERLPFVPNFDHWLNVNRTNKTLPKEYQDMSRNDIVRAVGGTIWARTGVIETSYSPEIEVTKSESGDRIITEYRTPVGTVRTLHQYATDLTRALFLKEHWVKKVDDIRVVKYIAEHIRYSLNTDPFLQSEREVGEDGLSLVSPPLCLPYIEFGKNDAGWERGIYLFADYQKEVEELMEVYTFKAEEAARLLASSPVLVVHQGDNMDEWTTPPGTFRKYAIPFYRRIAHILHQAGKIYEVHWCGRTEHLLPFVPECDIDVVEAMATRPMSRLTIPEALKLVGENVVIQGGIPSVLLCSQGGSRQDFKDYLENLLPGVPHGYRFALGMGDNVPPDADFERVKMVAEILKLSASV
ncbi:MAG: uroporphyrinogen decarboxylase family protein [Candidatus Omnitrophota bacterium]